MHTMLTYTVVLSILVAGAVSATVKRAPTGCEQNDNGWPFMTGIFRTYLLRRNFNTDWKNRNVTECVSAVTLSKDDRTHTFEQNITYYNSSSERWISFRKVFTARAWGSYSTNINYYTAPGPGNSTLTYLMLHAGADCMVAKLLYRSNSQLRACEIWGSDSYFHRTESALCCDYYYAVSCDPTKQILYKPEECSGTEGTKKGKR
uniref:Putative salivary lipocalin n=1 Tax=Rhipicephalus pulchellus TaxID=72859 RepID=L7LPX6_RHIPC